MSIHNLKKDGKPMTFIATTVVQVAFRAPVPEEILTAIWFMPGHVRTMQHKNWVYSYIKPDIYKDGDVPAAVRDVIVKVEEGERP